jgi:ParB family transcriptional regulator, chromosome partitioning protein
MKIELDRIKPSPKPIRTTWDEEKMSELSQSLIEEGQVEPIGVHKNQDDFTIVWGHRRVEAARRAGWEDIEAVIVGQDEVNNLIQAGIENLAGEEMTDEDKAEWAFRLQELGLSAKEISRRSSVNVRNIYAWLNYKREKDAGVMLITTLKGGHAGTETIRHISEQLGDDIEAKKSVAAKVSEDTLTALQTREVARAYRDAPTPEVKKKILDLPVMSRDTAADILRRSINSVRMETGVDSMREMNEWEKERDERRAFQDFDFAVKEFLDSMKMFQQIAQKGSALVKYGKYSPEAAKFAIRKIDALIDDLKNYREALEGVE